MASANSNVIEITVSPYLYPMHYAGDATFLRNAVDDAYFLLETCKAEKDDVARLYRRKCEEFEKLKAEFRKKTEDWNLTIEIRNNTPRAQTELVRLLETEQKIAHQKIFLMVPCIAFLDELNHHQYRHVTAPFKSAIDHSRPVYRDYRILIKEHRDLEMIRAKCVDLQYSNISEFFDDFELLIRNAMWYLPEVDLRRHNAELLMKIVEVKLRELMASDVLIYSAAAVARFWKSTIKDIFNAVFEHSDAWILMEPTSPGALTLVDMKRRMESGTYLTPAMLQADMGRLLDGAYLAHPLGDASRDNVDNVRKAFAAKIRAAKRGAMPPQIRGAYRAAYFEEGGVEEQTEEDAVDWRPSNQRGVLLPPQVAANL